MNDDNSGMPNTPKLKDHELLAPFMEYLAPACVNLKPGETLTVYRTQETIPVDDYGQAPRPRRRFGAQALSQKLTPEEVETLQPRKRERIMGEWGLSCNDTEEAARQSFLFSYERLRKKGAKPEELEAYAADRGTHICRYTIDETTGLITHFDEHGHANLYLYEGVNLEDLRDKEYNYTTIDYQRDEG